MTTAATKTLLTPEDLLALPDRKNFELVNGELEELNVSALSCWIAVEIGYFLRDFLKNHPIGLIFGADNGYQCFTADPHKVRKPDASFIRHARLPANWQESGFLRVAPDLAVEVVSPHDLAYDLDVKVQEYLDAGVRLVWVINPAARIVRVHRADSTAAYLSVKDALSGDDVLPGFRCPVRSLFPPPAVVAPTDRG